MEFANMDHIPLRMKLNSPNRHESVFDEEPPDEFMTTANDEG